MDLAQLAAGMGNGFISMGTLRSFPGMAATTWLVVQFLKGPADRVLGKIKTRWLAFVVAELILFGLSYIDGTIGAESIILNLLNGIVVALAAMKGHEIAVEKL